MQTAKLTKGQSVTGKGHAANIRYQVLTGHRDGTYTVRSMFFVDERGNDLPGFIGHKYRTSGEFLVPIGEVYPEAAAKQPA